VLTLVGQLPDTSAFAASIRGGPEFRSWHFSNAVLVAIANLTYGANQQRGGKKSIKTLIAPPKKQVKKQVLRVADLIAQRKKRELEN
jgi:hypothetical protein